MAFVPQGHRPDPLELVCCNSCNWYGVVGMAVCRPNDLVRCPHCNGPVEAVPDPDTVVRSNP